MAAADVTLLPDKARSHWAKIRQYWFKSLQRGLLPGCQIHLGCHLTKMQCDANR
jgi:hypothetical protein